MLRYLVVLAVGCGPQAVSKPTAPVPKPIAKPAGDANTPCFAGQPALKAGDIYKELEKHSSAWYIGSDDWPPARTYGTCTVDRGKVHEADGSLVAEISCGVRVARRGIVDDLGLQIGARGSEVIERKERGISWARMTPMRCVSNGPGQVRCSFDQPEGTNTDPNSYVVAGEIGELGKFDEMSEMVVLTGEAAITFFKEREIVEMLVSMWCH